LVQRRESAADFQKFTLARVHLGNSRPAQAIPLLEGLLKKDPSNVHFKLSLGQAYILAGQYERSDQMGAELLAETNQKGIAHVLRANACIFQNNREEALGHLLKAEEESGENPNTRFLIAQAHFRLRRLGDAEENFRKALEIDPNLAKAWCGLASALTAQKRYSEAAEAAMEAVGLEYSMPVAHFLLGVALAQAGSTESGVRALETCVKLYPQSLLAHRWLAAIHTRVTGDAERARQHSESAEEIAADRRSAAQPEETPAARG
jgi:tetratricopeptide (TPR) repeat protein